MRVGLKRQLRLAVGAPGPRPADRHSAPTERDRPVHVPVAARGPLGVMAALLAVYLVELLLHERVQHAQSDTNAQRQQPLLRGAGQLAQRLLHTGGQHLLGGRLLGDRYVLLHGGSSFDLWSDHRARCHRQRTRRRDRRPTKFHEIWDILRHLVSEA